MTGGQVVYGKTSNGGSSANIFDSGNEKTTKKTGSTTTGDEEDDDDSTDVAVVIVTAPEKDGVKPVQDDSFKLPTIILAFIAAVLVAVIVYLFVRFVCLKKKTNVGVAPRMGGDETEPDAPQYHPNSEDKNMFARAAISRKANVDNLGDGTDPSQLGDRPSVRQFQTENGMNDDAAAQ